MPDVGAQSMMGGYSVEKFHREGGGGVCFHSLVKEPLIDAYWSPEGWYNTVFVVMQLVSCSALLRAVVINDRKARAGDHAAAKRLILPVYHRIVYMLIVADLVAAGVIVARLLSKLFETTTRAPDAEDWLADAKSLMIGLDWALLHWVVDGVAVFLCQPSAGQQAMQRAALLGLVPALGSFAMGYLKHRATVQPGAPCLMPGVPLAQRCEEGACGSPTDGPGNPGPSVFSCMWLPMLYQAALLVLYLRVWLAPRRELWGARVYRRPAAVPYVRFWAIFRLLTIASSVLLIAGVDAGFCADFATEAFLFTVGKAYFVYSALRADSQWWQCEPSSQDPRSAGKNEQLGFSLSSPLVGRVDIEAEDASVLNDELAAVEKAIVIPFGHLWLNKTDVLGYGGSARVYRARYRDETVAAKVMYCPSIEASMVRNFFKEAAVLKRVEHPNIVELRGVCVLPPTVCIVMELCVGGSLTSWLEGRRQKWFPGGAQAVFFTGRKFSVFKLMEHAAAGVAQVHRHSLIHLDIKSMNFLVAAGSSGASVDVTSAVLAEADDPEVTVKLADLENTAITAEFGHVGAKFRASEVEVPDTLDWTAPELLKDGGAAATFASDVYALAITCWEAAVLAARTPTGALVPPDPSGPETPDMSVREKLIAGWRPSLSETGIPEPIGAILERGWGADVKGRPSAEEIQQAMERQRLQDEESAFTTS